MIKEWERKYYGKNACATIREEDCVIYRIKDVSGETVITRYEVAPGVALVYNDAHTQSIFTDDNSNFQNILEINHCREGRIEFETVEGEYLYIKKGDMAINTKAGLKEYGSFPQSHYHGVTLEFDLDMLQNNPIALLKDFQLDPAGLKEKFCKDNACFVLHEKKEFEHLFTELYCVPDKIRKRYYKLKITEILLWLSVLDMKQEQIKNQYFNRDLVASVKEVHSYMLSHLDEKITIDLLVEKFRISATNLKKCFREIYGNSLYAYLKETRIHKAAELLKESELDIGTIAGMVGYDNASKFAKSFKSILGINPRDYRKSVRMDYLDSYGVEKQADEEYNKH